MENVIKDYILKQYESIGQLQGLLRDLFLDGKDAVNRDYMLMAISASLSYREDWLRVKGLQMTLDEYKLWESIRKKYEPEPSGLLG